MFFVLNKKKINSYLLSLGMVAILFTVSVISANNLYFGKYSTKYNKRNSGKYCAITKVIKEKNNAFYRDNYRHQKSNATK